MISNALNASSLRKEFFFFGRKDIIDIIYKRLASHIQGYRQNIAILGPLYMGKTFLITHFFQMLHPDSILPIYINVSDISFKDFVRNFMETVLSSVSSNGYNLDKMPKTNRLVQEIELGLSKGAKKELLKKIFDLPELVGREVGKKVILVFNDFNKIQQFKIRDVFALIGKKIMIQKDVMYFLLSSSVEQSKNIINNELSLLFGKFEVIVLDHTNFDEAKKFVQAKLFPITCSDTLLSFFIGITYAHPFYIDIITDSLLSQDNESSKTVFKEQFFEVLEELLCHERGYLFQLFTRRCEKILLQHGTGAIEVLLHLADKSSKRIDLNEIDGVKKSCLNKILDLLLQEDVLYLDSAMYRINDRLFKFWLKYVYSIIRGSKNSSSQKEFTCFRDSLETLYQQYLFYAKDNSVLISRMIESFNSQKISLKEKNIVLLKVSKVEQLKSSSYRIQYLLGKGKTTCCFGVMRNDICQEKDVYNYVDTMKKKDIKKRFLLCPKGIEQNAHLVAKQHKMFVFVKKDINSLLELLNQPIIV